MHKLRQEVNETISRVIHFLEESQGSDGMWKDYQLITGESTSWVTAYTGCALLQLQSSDDTWTEKVSAMIQRAQAGLLQDETFVAGGWGYNPKLYPDADSTAITLRFLLGANVAVDHPAVKRGLTILKHAQLENGGCSTYNKQDLKGENFSGWTRAHLSVTMACVMAWAEAKERTDNEALIAQLDTQIKAAFRYLTNQSKHMDSLWEDYWWVGPYYPTYMTVAALDRFHILDNIAKDELTTALLQRQNRENAFATLDDQADCFATALSLHTLMLLNPRLFGESKQTKKAITWLFNQEHEGQFPPGALMRIPTPTISRQEEEKNQRITTDVNGIFTTATVLSLLSHIPVLTERME